MSVAKMYLAIFCALHSYRGDHCTRAQGRVVGLSRIAAAVTFLFSLTNDANPFPRVLIAFCRAVMRSCIVVLGFVGGRGTEGRHGRRSRSRDAAGAAALLPLPTTTIPTMPIRYTDDPATPAALEGAPEDFVVFYSSRDESGKLWCPVHTAPFPDIAAAAHALPGLPSRRGGDTEHVRGGRRASRADRLGGTEARVRLPRRGPGTRPLKGLAFCLLIVHAAHGAALSADGRARPARSEPSRGTSDRFRL